MERSAWKTLANATTDDSDSRYFYYCPAGTGSSEAIISGRLWIGGITLNAKPLEPLTFTLEAALGSTIKIGKCA